MNPWRTSGPRFTTCSSCERPYVGTASRCMDCREARMRRFLVGLGMFVAFLVGLAMAVGW